MPSTLKPVLSRKLGVCIHIAPAIKYQLINSFYKVISLGLWKSTMWAHITLGCIFAKTFHSECKKSHNCSGLITTLSPPCSLYTTLLQPCHKLVQPCHFYMGNINTLFPVHCSCLLWATTSGFTIRNTPIFVFIFGIYVFVLQVEYSCVRRNVMFYRHKIFVLYFIRLSDRTNLVTLVYIYWLLILYGT